jgi:hypothetical protein
MRWKFRATGIGLIRSDGLGRADKSGNQSSRQQGLRKRKVKEVVYGAYHFLAER